MSLIGKFVSDLRYGPAKVIASEGEKYIIEYFLSPWNRKQITTTIRKSYEPVPLFEQTRVYVEIENRWQVGRIATVYDREDGGYDYRIQFPNQQYRDHSEEDLYCRCWMPHDDPTSSLAFGGMETQYFYERRQRFSDTLLAQRSACRGMAAILSSNIEFVPHQLNVVHRVLEDPLQRYLLADEVGMGKTIEAGLVIRQFLLSHSEGDVWVFAPKALTKQWTKELEQKFLTTEFPDRVGVFSIDQIEELPCENAALLVLDEAHHIVAHEIPISIQRVVLSSSRVLLLSATPSLGRPEVLLRLLTLLDPDCYAGVTTDEFSEKVEKREEIGIFIRGLRVDANPAILQQRLRRLSELFGSDEEALRLGHCVQEALTNLDQDLLARSIHALRGYIVDIYRIHQRLIRTRRRDAADWVFRPRGPKIVDGSALDLRHVNMIWIADSRFDDVFDLFEQWRIQMSSTYPTTHPLRVELASWVVLLFDSIGSGLDCFKTVLSGIPPEFLDEHLREAFIKELDQTNQESTRSDQIASYIKRHLKKIQQEKNQDLARIAIFGSDQSDVKSCALALGNLIGGDKVLLAKDYLDHDQDIATTLESDEIGQVLFCTRDEEEGLNLNFFDAIVHLDTPFSPSRIEQRIGRLDRFGRRQNRLEQSVVLPAVTDEDSSLWEAWFDLLAHAFCIFNEPIADVQFSLDEITLKLRDALLEQGASGLREAIDGVHDMLTKERERLDNQYALDQVIQLEDSASDIFHDLDDLEADEIEIAEATLGWAKDVLQLRCRGDYREIFRFEWDRDRTQLPLKPWGRLLKPGLEGCHTFLRRHTLRKSLQRPPQLLRIGSSLMKSIEHEYIWDDRGTAYSTWRQVLPRTEQEWLGFKLHFIIEARLPKTLNVLEKDGLRARMDGYFPPWSNVIYIDAELKPVVDTSLLNLMSLPFKGEKTRGLDFNLGSRLDALFGLIDSTQFERLCFSIRNSSETWLREQHTFKDTVDTAYERGRLDIEHRIRRLNQRREIRTSSGEREDSGLSRQIELNESILSALRNPIVKLDAIGAIVLSGRSPQEFIEDNS
jgi:ATP-dependent helicase HepA